MLHLIAQKNILFRQHRDWHLSMTEIWEDKSLNQYMFVSVSAFRN